MRRDASEISEIIEVFDTDGPLVGNGFDATRLGESEFHSAAPDDGADADRGDPRRRRWVIPAGVTALVAVVTVGVATGSNSRNAATATTSGDSTAAAPITLATLPPTVPPTSVAVGTGVDAGGGVTTVPPPTGDPPRYVVDLGEGYAPSGTGEGSLGTADVLYSQLWATPGASRRSGAWVGITRSPSSADQDPYRRLQLIDNAYTIAIGTATAVVRMATSPDDISSVVVGRDDGTLVVEGFGVSPLDLTAIAEAAGNDPATPFDTTAPDQLDGFTKVIDATSSWGNAEASGPMTQMVALRRTPDPTTGQYGTAIITTTLPSPWYAAASPFLLDAITPFTAADGSIGIAGISNHQPLRAQAYWVDHNGWAVTVNIDGGVDRAIAAAQSAHVADDAEWAGLTTDFAPSPDPSLFSDQATVQTFTFGAGQTAVVAIDLSGVGSSIQNSWSVYTSLPDESVVGGSRGGTYGGSSLGANDVARIAVLASPQRTFVMANVPPASAGATLTVTHDGGAATTVLLAEPRPDFPVLGAVVTFEQVGPFTAVITAADGTVLASWPPLTDDQ